MAAKLFTPLAWDDPELRPLAEYWASEPVPWRPCAAQCGQESAAATSTVASVGHAARGRWQRPVLALLAAASVAGIGATRVGVSGAAAADTTSIAHLKVEAGYGGAFRPGKPFPVLITVSTDRLVQGRLELTSAGPGGAIVLPVEVAGGAAKQYTLVMFSAANDRPACTVRLVESGSVLASTTATVESVPDQELVGLLPGALGGQPVPGPQPLSIDAGTARFVTLTDAELLQAPASFGPLSVVAATRDDLSRLPVEARSGLVEWVATGGHLLVDPGSNGPATNSAAAATEPIAGLPASWQPDTTRGGHRAVAGLGDVRLTSPGALSGRQWAGLIEPTDRTNPASRMSFGGPSSLGDSLARVAGVTVPRLGWLVGFLVAYVLLVGPLTFELLRRIGRAGLIWTAVPTLAVAFTAFSYIAGANLRRGVSVAQGTILQTGSAGPHAITYLGVLSRHGGTTRLRAPTGWLVSTIQDNNFSGQAAGQNVSQLVTDAGPDAALPLDAGQFGVVVGEGPVSVTGALEVTAASAIHGQATGTVKNTTPYPLEDVAVFVGNQATAVGSLAPGAQRTWQLTTGNNSAPLAEMQVWPTAAGFGGPPDPNSPIAFAVWQLSPVGLGPGTRQGGLAVAAGWTRAYLPALSVAGGGAPHGSTAVVGEAAVTWSGGSGAAFDGLAVRTEFVRGWSAQAGPAGVVMLPGGPIVARFTLPTQAPASGLSLTVPVVAGQGGQAVPGLQPAQVEVWSAGAWHQLSLPSSRLSLARAALPPGAVQDGVIYVRLTASGPFDLGSLSVEPSA